MVSLWAAALDWRALSACGEGKQWFSSGRHGYPAQQKLKVPAEKSISTFKLYRLAELLKYRKGITEQKIKDKNTKHSRELLQQAATSVPPSWVKI